MVSLLPVLGQLAYIRRMPNPSTGPRRVGSQFHGRADIRSPSDSSNGHLYLSAQTGTLGSVNNAFIRPIL